MTTLHRHLSTATPYAGRHVVVGCPNAPLGALGGLEVSSTSRFGKSYNSWDDYESVGMINPNIWIYIYTPSGYLMIINDG